MLMLLRRASTTAAKRRPWLARRSMLNIETERVFKVHECRFVLKQLARALLDWSQNGLRAGVLRVIRYGPQDCRGR